jgi:hypothetical protein
VDSPLIPAIIVSAGGFAGSSTSLDENPKSTLGFAGFSGCAGCSGFSSGGDWSMSSPFVVSALRLSAGDFFVVEIAAEVFAVFFDRFIGGIKMRARRHRRYPENGIDPGLPQLPAGLTRSIV